MKYQPVDIAPFLLDTQQNGTTKPTPANPAEVSNNPATQQEYDLAHVECLVQRLQARGADITADYGDWIKAGYSLASLGESGRSFYHSVCKMYPSYDPDECERMFSYQLGKYIPGKTNISTFVDYCNSAGIDTSHPWKKKPNKDEESKEESMSVALPELPEADILAFLNDAEVDLSEELSPPQVCLEIEENGQSSIIGTRGNFSMVIGKAKSKKTFFITMCLAAAVHNGNVLGMFKGTLPSEKNLVLYFDTEQSKYHVQKAARRVLHMAGNPRPDNFRAYGLRKFHPTDRLKIIEQALYKLPKVGLVVIDGIRDLISSINDEEQATMIASKLLKWTEELNIHIMCVLHQNKGDNNARGHVGTELQNKAETVLSITKDPKNKEMSIVEAEYCREREFEPFAFDVDNFGIPQVVEGWNANQSREGPKKPSDMPSEIPTSKHCEVLKMTFEKEESQIRSQLLQNLKYSLGKHGISIGDNKVKEYITFYVQENLIAQHGKAGTKNSNYKLNI
jgi:hypothetical protein